MLCDGKWRACVLGSQQHPGNAPPTSPAVFADEDDRVGCLFLACADAGRAGPRPGGDGEERAILGQDLKGWKARETYEIVSSDEFIETFRDRVDGRLRGSQPEPVQAKDGALNKRRWPGPDI